MSHVRKIIILSMGLLLLLLVQVPVVSASEVVQQPTVAVATVTGTPQGPTARVNQDQFQINVRSGPGTEYGVTGVLVAGQVVPAYGRSAAGLWIQIGYAGVEGGIGWVYSPLVTVLQAQTLPIIEPPPTPTPLVTPTIDPTLAAQFVAEVQATRLPTFTAPPPLAVPTFAAEPPLLSATTFPMGLVILILGTVGLLGMIFTLVRR